MVSLLRVIEGGLASIFGIFGLLTSWWIIPPFIETFITDTTLKGILWAGLLFAWILFIFVAPAVIIFGSEQETV